jgi:putative transcriptional regulator
MANHITVLRNMAKIKTAKEAANELGISPGMLYQIEEGLKKPSPRLALALSSLFNCSLEDIFLPYYTTNSDNSITDVKSKSIPKGR